MSEFRALEVLYAGIGERHTFIVEATVTREDILSGKDDGIVCQVIDTRHTHRLLAAMNASHEHEPSASKPDS